MSLAILFEIYKDSRTALLAVCCFIAWNLHAQNTTDETPYGLRDGFKALFQEPVIIPAPDMEVFRDEAAYAYGIRVAFAIENMGVWQQLEDGGKIWRLKVHLPGALGTNTYYDKFWLPEGGKFFVYNEETKQSIGAVTADYIDSNRRVFTTSLIYGENVVYEYYQPESVRELPIISIFRIDYAYQKVNNPYSIGAANWYASDSNQVNVNCQEGDKWKAEKHAVVKISNIAGDYTYWCSGALVNNTNNDYTAYVLTADHCLRDGTYKRYYDAEGCSNLYLDAQSDASTMIFYWEYEYPGCSNSSIVPLRSSAGNATVVANNDVSDFALIRIDGLQNPRYISGVCPYFLGWDNSGASGIGGVGIHHPLGDVKKIASAYKEPISIKSKYEAVSKGEKLEDNFEYGWLISFEKTANGHSVTEPGSSGSPFINNHRKVIGQAKASVINQGRMPYSGNTLYGKFNVSWTGNDSDNSKRRLRDWLAPGITIPPQTLNGTFAIDGATTLMLGSTSRYRVANLPGGFTWESSSNINIKLEGNDVQGDGTALGPGYLIIKDRFGVEVARLIINVVPAS